MTAPSPPRRPRTLHEELALEVAQIRGEVHGCVGDRPYRVFLVKRLWSGGEPGRGEQLEVERVELRCGLDCHGQPTPPKVVLAGGWSRSMHGVVEDGRAFLEELDPTYTEAELSTYGRLCADETAHLEILSDDRDGLDEKPIRKFRIDAPPYRDARRFFWSLRLRAVDPQGVFPTAQEAP